MVYSLEKFRIYIFGHEIYLKPDNKAISFISYCALSSIKIARWVIQIQEYKLHTNHIRGARNFLADTISRKQPMQIKAR